MVVSMVDPTERLVVDSERYQNRDFSLRMKAFKARRNQAELLVLGDSRSRHGVMASELVGDDITGFNLAPTSSGIEVTAELALKEALKPSSIWSGVCRRGSLIPLERPGSKAFFESPARQDNQSSLPVRWADKTLSFLSVSYRYRGLLKSIVKTELGWAAPGKEYVASLP